MFNLIVSNNLENDRHCTITADRVFEYTNDAIIGALMQNGQIDASAVCALPTIFMKEGTKDEVVSVGWITKIDLHNKMYRLSYSIDPEIPRMTNANVQEMASDLKLHDWEFSRNHWAVKDVDLFSVLYRRMSKQKVHPTVFQLSKNPVNPKLISLMMPFSAEFTRVYDALKSGIESAGFQCRRADDIWVHSHIMQDILELICTSRVVICDLSEKNPNVLYETGIAHTLGKEVILLTQHIDYVPFDLRALRCITYLRNQEGCEKLVVDVLARLRSVT